MKCTWKRWSKQHAVTGRQQGKTRTGCLPDSVGRARDSQSQACRSPSPTLGVDGKEMGVEGRGEKPGYRVAWLAQSVMHTILDHGVVVSLSLTLGVEFT